MRKKMLIVMLTLTLLVWNVPAAGVYAVSDPGEGPSTAEYSPDRVLVLYVAANQTSRVALVFLGNPGE